MKIVVLCKGTTNFKSAATNFANPHDTKEYEISKKVQYFSKYFRALNAYRFILAIRSFRV